MNKYILMKKKDKLYTVNKWNKNLFAGGGSAARWDRLASAAYGAKYGDTGYTVEDYMNSTGNNWFGISKADNPFSKGNIGGTLSTAATAISPFATSLISNGYSTGGIGEGVSSIGNTIGSGIGGPIGAAVSLGSGLLGGLINAGWGIKENKPNIASIKNNTGLARTTGNELASSTTTGSLIDASSNMASSSDFGTKDLYKGGWFAKDKARKKGQKLINQENAALAYQGQGLMLGANNVDSIQNSNVMSNFAAYGGLLDSLSSDNMGATNYSLMSDYLLTKQKQSENKNKLDGVASIPNVFADGGIEIKHPGRLTALKKRTGKTEAELWAEGRPEVRKMITFARNARKWSKAYGGLLDTTDKLFPQGGPLSRYVGTNTKSGIEQIKDLYDSYHKGGTYGGGRGIGGGAGTKNWDLPEYETTVTNDTIWVPVERNFNDAFREAARKGLTEFKFNGVTHPVEYANKKGWEEAGNARKEITFVPVVTEKKHTERKKSAGGPLNVLCGGGKMFALGGDYQTNGTDWTNGLVTIGAGGTHEENPNDGIQVGVDNQGIPNLVEEGEVIYNDYVYSARIEADDETKQAFHISKKRAITYADLAKKLEKESLERPNDPISKAALKVQMENLANQQERQKAEMQAEEARRAFEALSPEEQVAVMQEAQAQEQATQEAAIEEHAMAEQQAMNQQVPPEMMGQVPAEEVPQEQVLPQDANMQMTQEPVVAANGGKLVNKFDGTQDGTSQMVNAGTWKTGDTASNWHVYVRQGLMDYLEDVAKRVEAAPNLKEKDAIRNEAIKTVNDIQQAYADAYQSNLTPSKRKEAVLKLQTAFRNAGGNKYFSNIADAINIPAGHNTTDNVENDFEPDSLWGPKTSLRNWGSTEYFTDPEYYRDIDEMARRAGLRYSANLNMTYGDNGYQLYGLSAISSPDVQTRSIEGLPTTATERELPDDTELKARGINVATNSSDVTDPSSTAANHVVGDVRPIHRAEWPRYVGLFGPAVGLGLQAAGFGRPDTSSLNSVLEGYNRTGAAMADYKPIGDYIAYRPMDIWAEQNRLNANARATDRALLNNNSASRAAGLLASAYNNQIANGQLYRQALEYNDNLRKQVADFNRGTNIQNANAYNQVALANAQARNADRQYRAQLASNIASQKMNADSDWYGSIYANIGNLFQGISDLGRENAEHNTVADMAADGLFGVITKNQNIGRGYVTSKGGKLKKKKRGLTF